jgi:hypothetical protein
MAKSLESNRKSIKSISTWRYSVDLSQDDRGVFYVKYENTLTKQVVTRSFIDYALASHTFEAKLNSFQGH